MKNRSRFVVFILSVVPGLSHLYLGCNKRALVFFMAFLGICIGGGAVANISSGFNIMVPMIFFAAALVWFTALSEAMQLAKNPVSLPQGPEEGRNGGENEISLFINDRKLIALAFSVIPGAGHMFLGLLKPGAQLMAIFFTMVFFSDWLDLGLLGLLAPVVWFYSLFDIYHLLEEEEEYRLEGFSLSDWVAAHPHWVGWGLITLGIVVVIQRLAGPALGYLLSAQLRNCIESGFVALVLIAGGIKLLVGSRVAQKEGEAK